MTDANPLKFMFATLVTALCLDSVFTHIQVLQVNPGILGWVVVIFCTKLVGAAIMVAIALWCRSAWRSWRS